MGMWVAHVNINYENYTIFSPNLYVGLLILVSFLNNIQNIVMTLGDKKYCRSILVFF